MWNKEYNQPKKPEKLKAVVESVDNRERKSRRDFFLNIIALIFLALFIYGLFFYLPSITTGEINCDDPTEVILMKRNWHPMIPHPCDTIPTMHPLRHLPK